MSTRRRRSVKKTSNYSQEEEEDTKFVLGDEVFVALRQGRTKCGIVAKVQNKKPTRYLVNLYPYPTQDGRYYEEHQLTKVTKLQVFNSN